MKTGVLFIPGHNAEGKGLRYCMAPIFGMFFGLTIRVLRIQRQPCKNGVRVSTPTQEYEQAVLAAKNLRMNVDRLLVAGHSQGGAIAARVVSQGVGDGLVHIMGDYDARFDTRFHLCRLNTTLSYLRKQPVSLQKSNGKTYWYYPDFFDDYRTWDIPNMVSTVTVPSLFVAGLQDDILLPKHIKRLSQKAQHGAYAEINAPHRFGVLHMLQLIKIIKKWSEETIPQ